MAEGKSERNVEIYRVAQTLFSLDPDWLVFFREILGIEGLIRKEFPSREEAEEFERSEEYLKIQELATKLRDRNGKATPEQEPASVITVRLPRSVHDALRTESHTHKISMNRLCLAKLLKPLDEWYLATAAECAAEIAGSGARNSTSSNDDDQ